jgi:hypothetical protein
MRFALRLSVLLGSLVALYGCGPSMPSPPAPTLSETLAGYGYVELQPPSLLLPPGTLVRVKGRDPLKGGIVCTQKSSLGEGVAVLESPSKDTVARSLQGAGYRLDLSVLPILGVKAEYASVDFVEVKLENVHVLELADDTVYEGVERRSDGCRKAMAGLLADPNEEITMVKSVLRADVSYEIKFKAEANLGAATKLDLVKALGADLGADASTATESAVRGTSLYWGVIDEKRLAQVGTALESGTRAAKPNERALPAGAKMELDPTPIAE